MRHSALCFNCEAIEAAPGDLCENCKTHIQELHELQMEMELSHDSSTSPMREWVESVLAPMFGFGGVI